MTSVNKNRQNKTLLNKKKLSAVCRFVLGIKADQWTACGMPLLSEYKDPPALLSKYERGELQGHLGEEQDVDFTPSLVSRNVVLCTGRHSDPYPEKFELAGATHECHPAVSFTRSRYDSDGTLLGPTRYHLRLHFPHGASWFRKRWCPNERWNREAANGQPMRRAVTEPLLLLSGKPVCMISAMHHSSAFV